MIATLFRRNPDKLVEALLASPIGQELLGRQDAEEGSRRQRANDRLAEIVADRKATEPKLDAAVEKAATAYSKAQAVADERRRELQAAAGERAMRMHDWHHETDRMKRELFDLRAAEIVDLVEWLRDEFDRVRIVPTSLDYESRYTLGQGDHDVVCATNRPSIHSRAKAISHLLQSILNGELDAINDPAELVATIAKLKRELPEIKLSKVEN